MNNKAAAITLWQMVPRRCRSLTTGLTKYRSITVLHVAPFVYVGVKHKIPRMFVASKPHHTGCS
jgi:hypothetical protein